MLKILQILTDTNIGGAGMWLLNFLEAYDREKLDVAVVIPYESALKERIEALGVRTVEADGIDDISFTREGVTALKSIIKEEAPDLVHTHACLSARIAARLLKVPVVNTRHCIEPPRNLIGKIIYGTLNKALSDRAVAVSEAVKFNLIDDGIPEDRIEVIYNGVKPLRPMSRQEIIAAKEKYKLDGCCTVGIFARLEPVKNHMMFLTAAAAAYEINDKFRFLIVGDGSMRDELEAEARALGLGDAVTFTGFVDDISELMNVTDINVITSDSEAMSIALVEGMSLGKPSIATDCGGPWEVLDGGRCGMIIPIDDAISLTAAIVMLAADTDLASRYSEEARKTAREIFSPDEMCRKLLALYEDMAGRKEEAYEEV